jgi:gas vesicle protein
VGEDPNRIREQIDETRSQLGDSHSEEIRSNIDQTRTEMGETVAALGHKADVKGRVSESVSQKKNAVFGAVGSGKNAVVGGADALVSRVTGMVPDKQQVVQGADRVGISRHSPVSLVVTGGAVGLLAGLLVPSTQIEDEHVGDMADQLKQTARETGSEVVERGKQVAGEAASAASESASQQQQELTETLQENVKQAAPSSS